MIYLHDYNSKLIFFGQICDNNITYIQNFKVMTLIQKEHIIAHGKYD